MSRLLTTQAALRLSRSSLIRNISRSAFVTPALTQNVAVCHSQRSLSSVASNSLKKRKLDNFVNRVHAVRYNAITASTDGSEIPDDVRNLTIEEYHKYSDATFEQITEELDAFFEDNGIMEAEVDEEAGVMEINCSEGTYVINKQPPTKQIWLSSPISGPKRFDLHDGKWICLRDNVLLSQLLAEEMSEMYSSFQWSQPF